MAKIHDIIKKKFDGMVEGGMSAEKAKDILLMDYKKPDIDTALTVVADDGDTAEAKQIAKDEHMKLFCEPYIRVYRYPGEVQYYLLKDKINNVWQRYTETQALTAHVYQQMVDAKWSVRIRQYALDLWMDWILMREAEFENEDALPAAFCNHLETGPCLMKMGVLPAPGDCPHFKKWLETLSDPGAFCAWVWACVLGRKSGKKAGHSIRQNLWLYGEGVDGKSAVVGVIGDNVFGRDRAFKVIGKTSGESKFDAAHMETARLISNPDSNNPTELLNSFNKSLSGSDSVSIEHKGKAARTGKIGAMLWINSNPPPLILREKASISRIIPILLTPHKDVSGEERSQFVENLTKELPQFLTLCEEYWNKLNDGGSSIKLNDTTHAIIKQLIEEGEAPVEELLRKVQLEFAPGEFLSKDIMTSRREAAKMNPNSIEWKNIVKFLKTNGAYETTQNGMKGWSGIKIKSKSPALKNVKNVSNVGKM